MSLPCDEHVVKVHNKIIFSFDTFVIITTQPCRWAFLCLSAISDF
jgi:hypothetical protein